MIFVTVGTTSFTALVEAMDTLSQSLGEPVVMQIGRSRCEPAHCEWFRFAPSLTPYYERASVVVAHGGYGALTEALRCGKLLVGVEDPDQPDRHQRDLLREFSRTNYLIWCKDLSALPDAIRAAQGGLTRYSPPECSIHTHIENYLRRIR